MIFSLRLGITCLWEAQQYRPFYKVSYMSIHVGKQSTSYYCTDHELQYASVLASYCAWHLTFAQYILELYITSLNHSRIQVIHILTTYVTNQYVHIGTVQSWIQFWLKFSARKWHSVLLYRYIFILNRTTETISSFAVTNAIQWVPQAHMFCHCLYESMCPFLWKDKILSSKIKSFSM